MKQHRRPLVATVVDLAGSGEWGASPTTTEPLPPQPQTFPKLAHPPARTAGEGVHGDRPSSARLACTEPGVTALLRFVEARYLSSVRARRAIGFATHDETDLGPLTAVVLDRARHTCGPTRPCPLTAGELRVLRRVAVQHDSHPDFDHLWHYGV